MKKADSIECLVRNNEKCNIEKDRIGETDTLFLRRSLSENLPLFLPGEVSNTPPNLRKNKSLKSRLSLRLRSLRDRHLLPHKTHFSDAIQHKTQQQSVDRLDTENSLQSGDLGSGEIFKKKRRLTKKFLLGGIKWAKSKTVDDNLLTIATQISSVVENCSTVKVDNSQFDVNNRLLKKPAPIEPKQKLLITISGRKTEFKNQISGKNIESSSGDPSSQSRELYKIQRERITPTTERGAIFQYQEFNRNLTFTVASTEQSLPEFSCQERGAVRKVSRSTRLERQTSQEEFFEDKLHFPPRDLSQERGSRFPRPLPYTVQQKTTKDERISRVQDYLNETLAQSNSSGPKATENDKIINKKADISSLNDSQKVKNSSLFHLVSSNDSDDSRSSDAARRRIKYVGQPTLYTDEEKDILEGKRDAFKNLEGISEYSFESDFPSEAQMPAFSGQLTYPEEAQIMTSAVEKREHLYKILVIGELGTGKTSFIKRYVHQFFSANYRATIGVDFALKVLHWDQNTIVRLQLWDIAGQERFGNMTRVYYKEAVGAFIVFDVTRSGTFDAVNKWKEDLDSKVQLPGGGSIPCILLANKCDQDKQGIVTNPEEMDEYVKENGFSGWYETSAKENINIEEAARALVSQILLNDKLITATDIMDTDKFALASASEQPGTTNTKKNCAC